MLPVRSGVIVFAIDFKNCDNSDIQTNIKLNLKFYIGIEGNLESFKCQAIEKVLRPKWPLIVTLLLIL